MPFNYYIIPFNKKFLPMSAKDAIVENVKRKSRFLEFHGELFLFGVKVWDFRIPPQSVSSDVDDD